MRNFIIFTIFLLTSCSSNRDSDKMIELNDDTKKVISDYIIKNQKFDAFILMSTDGLERHYHIDVRGLLLGPAYSKIIEKYPSSLYFDISGKRVFYLTEINNFLEKNSDLMDVKHTPDSIMLYNEIKKDPYLVFIHRAIYIYNDKYLDLVGVNFRPDTIFLPRRLIESTIHFENIIK